MTCGRRYGFSNVLVILICSVKVQEALRCDMHSLSGDIESHKRLVPLMTMGGALR